MFHREKMALYRACKVLLVIIGIFCTGCSANLFNLQDTKTIRFVQLCDPQLGMGGYEHDVATFTRAVNVINDLKPDFVVICGDLVNTPDDKSFAEFNSIKSVLKPPVYCAPGNHDVGATPDARSLSFYRQNFGKDYISFEQKGYVVIVTNTQLWKVQVEGESERHDRWFAKTLAQAHSEKCPIIVVGHIPLFLDTPDEKEEYFNLSIEKRAELLDLLPSHGVVAVLTGHAHRTIINDYEGILMVSGETTSVNFDKRPAGFRLWSINPESIEHKYIEIDKE